MGYKTEIAWADSTFNGWIGCTKISPACDNCYADVRDKKHGGSHWGSGVPRRRTNVKNWNTPIRWDKDAAKFFAEHGRRQRVFCASMSDVFDNEVPVSWRVDLFNLIEKTPNLDWLILTKRIGNVYDMLTEVSHSVKSMTYRKDEYRPLPNVCLGATICNQKEADRDIPNLLETPATSKFLSIEPLLGTIDISEYLYNVCLSCGGSEEDNSLRFSSSNPLTHYVCDAGCDVTEHPNSNIGKSINLVIVGAESGDNARPANPDAVRFLRDQCSKAGATFLFKQWGEWLPVGKNPSEVNWQVLKYSKPTSVVYSWPNGETLIKVGKDIAGHLLDGVDYSKYPEEFKLIG